MKKVTSTFGLSPGKLTRLVQSCLPDEVAHEDGVSNDQLGALLDQYLKGFLPSSLDKGISAAEPLLSQYERERCMSDKPMGELILDSGTPVDHFHQLKDYAKFLVNHCKSKAQNHIATTLYYAAISAGMVYHNTLITTFKCREIEKAVDMMLDKPWLTGELKTLFTQAGELCRKSDTVGEAE